MTPDGFTETLLDLTKKYMYSVYTIMYMYVHVYVRLSTVAFHSDATENKRTNEQGKSSNAYNVCCVPAHAVQCNFSVVVWGDEN